MNGSRVFHQKFGDHNVTAIDGNKLTIAFDRAGETRADACKSNEAMITIFVEDSGAPVARGISSLPRGHSD